MIFASYQGIPEENFILRLEQIYKILNCVDRLNASFICFPEGFLTYYFN